MCVFLVVMMATLSQQAQIAQIAQIGLVKTCPNLIFPCTTWTIDRVLKARVNRTAGELLFEDCWSRRSEGAASTCENMRYRLLKTGSSGKELKAGDRITASNGRVFLDPKTALCVDCSQYFIVALAPAPRHG